MGLLPFLHYLLSSQTISSTLTNGVCLLVFVPYCELILSELIVSVLQPLFLFSEHTYGSILILYMVGNPAASEVVGSLDQTS